LKKTNKKTQAKNTTKTTNKDNKQQTTRKYAAGLSEPREVHMTRAMVFFFEQNTRQLGFSYRRLKVTDTRNTRTWNKG